VVVKRATVKEVGDYHVVVHVGAQCPELKTASCRKTSTPVWERTLDITTPTQPQYLYGYLVSGRKTQVRACSCSSAPLTACVVN
jgi:hypothetical protein